MTIHSTIKKLQFETINDALSQLNASDKGRYFLCVCPECQQKEAFIYKNNLDFLQCNRENSCGERMLLKFREKEARLVKQYETTTKNYPKLTEEQAEAIQWSERVFNYINRYLESETLDNGYRGLSRETTQDFIVDLKDELLVSLLYKKNKSLLGKDYSNNDWMCKRNLVIPIYGEDDHIDRLLLRSSIDPSLEPKEIQLVMNPSKDTRDFFVDISKQSDFVVVSESILDALSFREVKKDIGIIALTGAAKTRQLQSFILKNKELLQDKKIILAMDNDKAGKKATQTLVRYINDHSIGKGWSQFHFPKPFKDANEYLTSNRFGFELEVYKYLDDDKGRFTRNSINQINAKERSRLG